MLLSFRQLLHMACWHGLLLEFTSVHFEVRAYVKGPPLHWQHCQYVGWTRGVRCAIVVETVA